VTPASAAPTPGPTVTPTSAPTASNAPSVVKITMNLDFHKWTAVNQTDFETHIKNLLPPSIPILIPFTYYQGSVVQEISVTGPSFNATVTNSLQFIQQQVNANMNSSEFANYKITSVALTTSSSGTLATGQDSDAKSSTVNGGMIAGIVAGVVILLVIAWLGSGGSPKDISAWLANRNNGAKSEQGHAMGDMEWIWEMHDGTHKQPSMSEAHNASDLYDRTLKEPIKSSPQEQGAYAANFA